MGDSKKITEVLRDHFAAQGRQPHTGVEVGTHRGALAARLLRAFPEMMLFCIDSYCAHDAQSPYYRTGDSLSRLDHNAQQEHYNAALRGTDFAGHRRTILRLPSVEAAQRVPCPRISFIFLDGDHSYEGTSSDIAAWWPRVEPGGVLAGHDYGHPRFDGVERAVREFATARNVEIKLVGSCWWAVMPAASVSNQINEIDSDDSE